MWLITGASVGGEEGASVVVVVVVEVVVVEVVVAVVVVLGVGLVLLICCKKFLLGGFLILDGRWVTICKVGGGGALVVGMVGSAVWPSSISGSVFSVSGRLPSSHPWTPKPAISSLGETSGWVSLSPLIWVTSTTGSIRARCAAYSAIIGEPSGMVISNIRPFETLGLCGIASTCPPVDSI